MKHLLPLFAIVILSGCSLGATVLTPETPASDPPPPALIYPAGFEGESTMLACKMDSRDECVRRGVVTDGTHVERIRNDEGGWTLAAESECRDGHCYVKDENGVEWKLEP